MNKKTAFIARAKQCEKMDYIMAINGLNVGIVERDL